LLLARLTINFDATFLEGEEAKQEKIMI
jgi:hypothetical protein